MDLFNTMYKQMDAVQLPLVAVTMIAAHRPNTPLVVILHWRGLHHASPFMLPGADIPPYSVPGSAIRLTHTWQSVEAANEVLSDAA